MKNSIGSSVIVTLFGESHGPAIGAVIDGLAPGIRIDTDYIDSKLELRKAYGKISTSRHEDDNYSIISGVYKGMTTGTPLCIIIPNNAQRSDDYTSARGPLRPGHADYTANAKYHGYEDYRGGGHFSGRITAALVAAGAVLMSALENKGIKIGTHIASLGGMEDEGMGSSEAEIKSSIEKLSDKRFAVLSDESSAAMQQLIEDAASEGDSIGGILETAITGIDAGVGEPWFDTMEGRLAHAFFSIPGVKGVEFGCGFGGSSLKGSEYEDSTFRPERNITRQEAMAIMSRVMTYLGNEDNKNMTTAEAESILSRFNDDHKVANWAKIDMAKCVSAGVVKGDDKGNLNPLSNLTRAEMSQLVYNLLVEYSLIANY